MPSEPQIMAISSVRMSPKVFSVTMTSNCFGLRTSCMAALSTYMCVSSTSGYSGAMAFMTSRHMTEEVSTLALSTLHSLRRRPRAASKATRAMRSTSLFL